MISTIRPLPDEVIVTKHRYGAFEVSDLDLVLRSQRIRTVVMTGVATDVYVETTARQAFLRDYYVVFTSDCTATYSQSDHEATLRNIDAFRAGGESAGNRGMLGGRASAAARGFLIAAARVRS